MSNIPTVEHPTDRPNFTRVSVGGLVVWYSYKTPIAYRLDSDRVTVVRQNDWNNTTGRHLTEVDGGSAAAKRARIDGPTFERQLSDVCDRIGAAL